jgi:DNA-binding IclR family transcriptional regulator
MSTVQKAIAVLGCFSIEAQELGVTEIARKLGANKVIVHRLLRDLEATGMVEQDPDSRRYRLGYELLRLASIRQSGANLLRAAIPHLDRLRDRTGESVHLSVVRADAVLRLYVVQTRHYLRFSADVGDESPLHTTAAGKTLLAFVDRAEWPARIARSRARFPDEAAIDPAVLGEELEQIRRTGHAVDDQVFRPLLRAFGAPVRDASGRVIASVTTGGVAARIPDARVPELIAAITETGAAISRDLGFCDPAAPARTRHIEKDTT